MKEELIMNEWNIYHCGLCEVDFAVSKKTDEGSSSCPKCESGEEVVRVRQPEDKGGH